MAYLQQTSNNQKAVTMGAVAAFHAIAIYAVVSGLAVSVFPEIKERFVGINIKQPKPTPPPPPPEQTTKIESTIKVPVTPLPLPPISTNPITPIPIDTIGGDEGFGGRDIGTVEFPTPSPPTPKFTAKGPKARGDQANWVRETDYPTIAIRQELEGLTRVKLEVNTAGRVTDCTVTGSSGHEVLDNAACAKLIDRARFSPATDTSGQVAAGTFNTAVRWQLPE